MLCVNLLHIQSISWPVCFVGSGVNFSGSFPFRLIFGHGAKASALPRMRGLEHKSFIPLAECLRLDILNFQKIGEVIAERSVCYEYAEGLIRPDQD